MEFKELTKQEMAKISGGVSRKEYCTELVKMIAANFEEVWDDTNRENAVNAFKMHCKDRDWNVD